MRPRTITTLTVVLLALGATSATAAPVPIDQAATATATATAVRLGPSPVDGAPAPLVAALEQIHDAARQLFWPDGRPACSSGIVEGAQLTAAHCSPVLVGEWQSSGDVAWLGTFPALTPAVVGQTLYASGWPNGDRADWRMTVLQIEGDMVITQVEGSTIPGRQWRGASGSVVWSIVGGKPVPVGVASTVNESSPVVMVIATAAAD